MRGTNRTLCLSFLGLAVAYGCADESGPLLLSAVEAADLSLVSQHLVGGTDPDVQNEEGQTPLHIAAHLGLDEIAVKLLDGGASIDARDGQGQQPIQLAPKGEFEIKTLAALLDRGADANARDDKGQTW